tara:strand:- start:229 stop:639 length:411 start_codon:yes stop_codon:yes gene_type:complete
MAITTTYTLNTSAGKNTGNLPYCRSVRVDAATTGIASAEVVELFKIPQGAQVIAFFSNVVTIEDSASTVLVGDGVDPNRYLNLTDMAVAGSTAGIAANLGYVYTADDTIDATFSAAAADTLVVDFTVVYVMNENAD